MPEIVYYSIGVNEPIAPDEPLPPLPAIPRGCVVVIEGRAPICVTGWRFTGCTGLPRPRWPSTIRGWERSSSRRTLRNSAKAI